MRNLKAFVFVAAAGVLLAGSLQAQTRAGQVTWKGVNGASGRYSNASTGAAPWNVRTSPYRAQFQINEAPLPLLLPAGTTTFGPTVDIFCVDFNNYAKTGTYGAYFTNLGTNGGDVGKYTRKGTGNTLENYLKAAYLAQKMPVSTAQQVGNLNGAIWYIMSGQPLYYSYSDVGRDATGIATYVLEAERNRESVNRSKRVVVTDVASAGLESGCNREYTTQVTPEPATMLLFGTVLVVKLMAAGALRRPTV